MLVKELMEHLSRFDPNMKVEVVEGYNEHVYHCHTGDIKQLRVAYFVEGSSEGHETVEQAERYRLTMYDANKRVRPINAVVVLDDRTKQDYEDEQERRHQCGY